MKQMRIQFSLTSAECRKVLARGFWSWPAVTRARRLILCKSTTCAALAVERWPDFPWQSFVAGITWPEGVCVNRLPSKEAVVEGDRWDQRGLASVSDLGPDDVVVKSGNIYDGERVGVLLGHKEGFGTMGVIFPGLAGSGRAAGCPAKVLAPMLTEKLTAPRLLEPARYPDSSLGWGARLLVYRPDELLDERLAMELLTGATVRIVGKGASADGYAVTTYHAEGDAEAAAKLTALVDEVKGTRPLPFERRGCSAECRGCTWRGRTSWRED